MTNCDDSDDPVTNFDRDPMTTATSVAGGRERVNEVLTEFADAFAREDLGTAENIMDSLGAGMAGRPACSHVISTGVEMLDTWYGDARLRDLLAEVVVPRWKGPARSVARELLRAAHEGGAYASLDEMVSRHGSSLVLNAAVLAVAGSVLAYADRDGASIGESCEYLFGFNDARGHAKTGAATGSDETSTDGPGGLLEGFEVWLVETGHPAEHVEVEVEMLRNVLDLASSFDLEPAHPSGAGALAEIMVNVDEEDVAATVLSSLATYSRFRIDTALDSSLWHETLQVVAEVTGDLFPEVKELSDAYAAVADLSETERRRALNDVHVVEGVFPLLAWLGTSQPTTPAGGVRRADIQKVSAMIGISARGFANPPPQTETLGFDLPGEDPAADADVIHVNSTKDLPQLQAWWDALKLAQIVERHGSTIQPGERAGEFLRGQPPPLEASETRVSAFTAEILMGELKSRRKWFSTEINLYVADRLRAAVTDRAYAGKSDLSERDELFTTRVSAVVEMLEDARLLSVSGNEIFVPRALRPAVLTGVMMARSEMSGNSLPGRLRGRAVNDPTDG